MNLFRRGYAAIELLTVVGLVAVVAFSVIAFQRFSGDYRSRADVEKTLSVFVPIDNEDMVNEDGDDFQITGQGGEHWLGTGATVEHSYLGLRMKGSRVPKGAKIERAELIFTQPSDAWITVGFMVKAEDSGDPAPFSSESRPSDRPTLSSEVSYSDDVAWKAGESYGYSVREVVQEYVDKYESEYISLVVKGIAGQWGRKFFYEEGQVLPRLEIEYSIPRSENPAETSEPTEVELNPVEALTCELCDVNGDGTISEDDVIAIGNCVFDQVPACFVNDSLRDPNGDSLLDAGDISACALCRSDNPVVSPTEPPQTEEPEQVEDNDTTEVGGADEIEDSEESVNQGNQNQEETQSSDDPQADQTTDTTINTNTNTITPADTQADESAVDEEGLYATPGVFGSVPVFALGTCSREVHDQYIVRGPDGERYRTWHPVQDPSGCTFAHDHGDDPTESVIDPSLPAFGYIGRLIGKDEPHVGFKVHVVNAGDRNDEGSISLLSSRLVFHMGTGTPKRFNARFHSMEYKLETNDGKRISLAGMADTGGVGSICQTRVGKTVMALGCLLDSPYEIWENKLTIRNRGNALVTAVSSTAVFDAITVMDPQNMDRRIFAWDPEAEANVFRYRSSRTNYRGCSRETYFGPVYWYNTSGRTVFYTDVFGNIMDGGPLRQEISTHSHTNFIATFKGGNSNDPQSQFKIRNNYCVSGLGVLN